MVYVVNHLCCKLYRPNLTLQMSKVCETVSSTYHHSDLLVGVVGYDLDYDLDQRGVGEIDLTKWQDMWLEIHVKPTLQSPMTRNFQKHSECFGRILRDLATYQANENTYSHYRQHTTLLLYYNAIFIFSWYFKSYF